MLNIVFKEYSAIFEHVFIKKGDSLRIFKVLVKPFKPVKHQKVLDNCKKLNVASKFHYVFLQMRLCLKSKTVL